MPSCPWQKNTDENKTQTYKWWKPSGPDLATGLGSRMKSGSQ